MSAVKLPEGYGAAAPKGAAVYAKAGEKYSAFMSRCMKSGKDMKTCAALYKKGSAAPTKTTRRRRAARILRRKKVIGYGYGAGVPYAKKA